MSSFREGDYVVYPTHGVGRFVKMEHHKVGEHRVNLFVIDFPQDRMTLRLPQAKACSAGLRPLCSREAMEKALEKLKFPIRHRKQMWNRRAQEYETKINSGDPEAIAEVIRDLYRANAETDQTYSERQVYQLAIERLARELAVVENIDEEEAFEKLENLLKVA